MGTQIAEHDQTWTVLYELFESVMEVMKETRPDVHRVIKERIEHAVMSTEEALTPRRRYELSFGALHDIRELLHRPTEDAA